MNGISLPADSPGAGAAALYRSRMAEAEAGFAAGQMSGRDVLQRRSDAADTFVRVLWLSEVSAMQELASGVALLAIGGYGRAELFPHSDLDLLFLLQDISLEKKARAAIRRVSQQLWDSGNRVTATTRALPECAVVDRDNVEFTLSLLDARPLRGDAAISRELTHEIVPAFLKRDKKALTAGLLSLKQQRHGRYGNTLFHLEPNVKECPGGLRDVHMCGWLDRLMPSDGSLATSEFPRVFDFLAAVRCFLHFRAGRDSNVLDWQSQDEAANRSVGVFPPAPTRDAAGWMQLYYRQARVVERRLEQQLDALPATRSVLRLPSTFRRRASALPQELTVENGRIRHADPSTAVPLDTETVLDIFQLIAIEGNRCAAALEAAIENSLPMLSTQMEEGAALWSRLQAILQGNFAGKALRAMHTIGFLELIIPEFHGIDALVVRDAYHRYTVDEHTFVLIDRLHGLSTPDPGPMAVWAKRFGLILAEIERPNLLYLAGLLHDVGKGRAAEHAPESVRLAEGVLRRWELDSYESSSVLNLIRNHLEMSAALRRDIFDTETVRAFAEKVETPEALRMLTLFTYADIQAVHPDALSPWKAENLWRLYIATSNFLDRSMDGERVDSRVSSELLQQLAALLPGETRNLLHFLEGFPQRYLHTRSPKQIQSQFQMSRLLGESAVQLELQWRPSESEITLVTPDQRLLFARVAGVLSGWGMNILSADAFSNAAGIVVDSFRFTDPFRTLEQNLSERGRLVEDLRLAIYEEAHASRIIESRKRRPRRQPLVEIATALTFDTASSPKATILEAIAQDHPGLLYSISRALAEAQCSIEVAVIDTEGDMAIDVFYLKRDGKALDPPAIDDLRAHLLAAIQPETA